MNIKVKSALVVAVLALGAMSFVQAQDYSTPERGMSPFSPNQQFRADIMDPAADTFDVGSGVLANVYQTDPGDPTESGYATVTFDLAEFAGQTVRLRFAQVDNQLNFQVGIDAVGVLLPVGADRGGPLVVANGSFETNGGAGTSTLNDWTVVDQPGGSGSWFAQTGTTSPLTDVTVPAPPNGSFAAMTDQTGPGSHVLYQDIAVPAEGGTLSFELYIGNRAGDFSIPSPNTLDFTGQVPAGPALPVPAMSPLGLAVLMLLFGVLTAATLAGRRWG